MPGQPSAQPAEARAPAKAGAGAAQFEDAPTEQLRTADLEPSNGDDAKTIALTSPVALGKAVPRPVGGAPAAGAPPNPSGSGGMRAAKQTPGLPSSARVASAPAAPPSRGDVPPGARKSSVQITDAGIDEAEAALEAMTSFRLAEAALQRNDLATAEAQAARALAGDPSQPDYISFLAWVRGLAGPPRIEEAIRTISKVLIEDPLHEPSLLYRGRLLVRTNRFAEALNDFNELLSVNPHHREAMHEARQIKDKLPPG
jgi:tetratricopeptide (TPR) repeat protein